MVFGMKKVVHGGSGERSSIYKWRRLSSMEWGK